MNGSIKPPRDDPHRLTQSLLPWFVTGRLDAAERAQVEAHLSDCAACRADERVERRLEAELATLPITLEDGWARMRSRLAESPPRPAKTGFFARVAMAWRTAVADAPGAPGAKGWAIAAQAVAMIMLVGLSWSLLRPVPQPEARYHTLSATPTPSHGNLLVMFRPQTTEFALRAVLSDNGAKIVDGPTTAGAYVIQVPGDRRAAVLGRLRGRPDVTLAEPIDPAGPP